ncbi:MAG TPA: SUMF1/EgtB/PvdO family nonheme iron enzyme [Bacteroidia bacterium]|jgi:hypothetical protein
MTEKNLVSEAQLDTLLNAAFLEMNASEGDVNAARFIFAQEYDVRIDARKEQHMLARLGAGRRNNLGYFLGLGIVLIAIFTYLLLNKSSEAGPMTQMFSTQHNTLVNVKKDSVTDVVLPPRENLPGPVRNKEIAPLVTPLTEAPVHTIHEALYQTGTPKPKPLFSETEIKMYDRIRDNVLDKLLDIDEKLYTKVGEGKVQFKGNPLGVDAFVIRNFAITNLEYKVFLADLFENGRADELKRAMVNMDLWNAYGCSSLSTVYFLDERYNNFPVVNVSREGALLFCKWLETRITDHYKVKRSNERKLKVRLPYDYEWIYSAKYGYAQIPDCGGYNTIYDIKEGLVDKSFLRRMSQIKKEDRKNATYMDELFATNRYGLDEKSILQIFEKGIRYNGEVSPDSIYPSGMSVLGKAGHVSEMINDYDGKPVIMGSCWASREQYLEMLGRFNASGGSPFVGFRVVITNEGNTYKNPFW